jgi:hypothetical protein
MKTVTLNRELIKLAQKRVRGPKLGDMPGAFMGVRLFVKNELVFACHAKPGQKVEPMFEILDQLYGDAASVIVMPATLKTAAALEKAAALVREFDAAVRRAEEDARWARKFSDRKQPPRPTKAAPIPAAPKAAKAAKAAKKGKGKAA